MFIQQIFKQIDVLQVRTFQRGCMGCDSFGGGVGDVADGETAGVLVLPPHGKAWQRTQNEEE